MSTRPSQKSMIEERPTSKEGNAVGMREKNNKEEKNNPPTSKKHAR